jgi:glutaconate CoA-transferase, subunit B
VSALPTIGGEPLDVFMACVMSREVRDGDWVSHGASVPLAGAALFLAMDTHAPGVEVWIQGCVTPANRNLADALIAPERIYETTTAHMSQTAIVDFSLRGNSMFQFLRPAQIDPHGNVNVSLIERGDRPPLRFHGIAVGDAINAVRRICLYTTEHSPRVFVESLRFRSGTGHHDGSDWRAGRGLPAGAGPAVVVTPKAVLDFDDQRRLRIRSVHPGVSIDDVGAATGFELGVAPDCGETPMPTDDEKFALGRVDPEGIRRLEFRETREEVLRYLATRAGAPGDG